MPILKTKKRSPFAYCGREKYGCMLVTERGINAVDRVAQEVSKSDKFDSSSFHPVTAEECTR